jgi:hypothetical protein
MNIGGRQLKMLTMGKEHGMLENVIRKIEGTLCSKSGKNLIAEIGCTKLHMLIFLLLSSRKRDRSCVPGPGVVDGFAFQIDMAADPEQVH